MKAIVKALKKNYLVEFKNDADFLTFITNFNDKIQDVEVITEDKLPELEKPVDVAKPSLSDGWKTLEKSAFVDKEKGVDKKGPQLGGKYAEFKYEPDKNLENSTDDKVSEPKNDSPALKGDEPKVADVEATAKEAEVKDSPKTDAPKAEKPKSEEHDSKTPEEHKEEKPEEEKKKEVKESVEDETLTPEQKEEVREYFKDIVEDKDNYPNYEEMIQAMRSLDSNGDISHEQYNYCLAHWDEWLSEFDPDAMPKESESEPEESGYEYDDDLNEVLEAAGVETNNINELKKQLEYAVRILRLYQDIEVNGQDYASKFLVKYGYARRMPDTNGEEDYYGTDNVGDVPRQLDAKY